MSSSPTSYLSLLASVVGTTFVFVLGAVVCIAVPALALVRLSSFSARRLEQRLQPGEDFFKAKSKHKELWDGVMGLTLGFLIGVYSMGFIYYWVWTESVVEGVVRASILVLGSSIAIAGCAAPILWFGRWFT
jgi:hypothetical protein